MLHTELLETWDEKGLPLEDFSVAGPKKKKPRRGEREAAKWGYHDERETSV